VRTTTTALASIWAVSTALAISVPNTAHAIPPAPASAPSGDVAAAKAKFDKGKTLYNAKNFADALVEFRASYSLVKSPNSHFFIANCLRDLGRLAEAHIEYDRVAAEAKTAGEQYAGAVDAALAERDALTPKLVLVNVTIPAGQADATLKVDSVEVTSDLVGKPVPAMPGNIEVTLSAPGKTPVTQSVTGAAGETKMVTVEFPAETPNGGDEPGSGGKKLTPLRIGAIAAAGVGVVGMVLFAVEGSASNTTYDRLKSNCSGPCPQSFAADVDKGKTQQTLANVGLGVGIAGLAVGATLFVVSMKKKPADATQPQTTWLIGPGSLGVRGTF
jgi:hypothetical protein